MKVLYQIRFSAHVVYAHGDLIVRLGFSGDHWGEPESGMVVPISSEDDMVVVVGDRSIFFSESCLIPCITELADRHERFVV